MDLFPPQKKLTTPTRCVCTNDFRGFPCFLYVYVVVFVSGKILLQELALDNLIGEADSMSFLHPTKSDQTTLLVVQCLVFQKVLCGASVSCLAKNWNAKSC